jgi:hypothetical protein
MRETTKSITIIGIMVLFALGVFFFVPNKTSLDRTNRELAAVKHYVDCKVLQFNVIKDGDKKLSLADSMKAYRDGLSEVKNECLAKDREIKKLNMQVAALMEKDAQIDIRLQSLAQLNLETITQIFNDLWAEMEKVKKQLVAEQTKERSVLTKTIVEKHFFWRSCRRN